MSLSTNNRRRDEHLRSADFFDVTHHPELLVKVHDVTAAGDAKLHCRGTLEAAGHVEPLELDVDVRDASADSVVLNAEVVVDRTRFSMTWSPLGIASRRARLVVVARFVRH
jgi:polyisoprenoid-binding protein YceI